MPSRDPINSKANAWMVGDGLSSSGPVRPPASEAPGRRPQRAMSGQVLRLAKRLGKTPEEIAAKIPPDTLERTKYPVIERVLEDGTRIYEHDLGIVEARKSLIHA